MMNDEAGYDGVLRTCHDKLVVNREQFVMLSDIGGRGRPARK